MRDLFTAVRVIVATLMLTGFVYPFAVTGVAQLLFAKQANGSLIEDHRGVAIGSALIGQKFARAGYVQSRPSAAGDQGYDATASGGSNLGVTSQRLRDRARADVARLLAANPDASAPIPLELVTASASGLDPHLSEAAILWQVPRIAHARGVTAERVRLVVQTLREGRDFGFLGEPRCNVLLVNLALDRQFGQPD